MTTVLVELPGGEGVVCRDDGQIQVTADVHKPPWQLTWGGQDLYNPITERLPGGRCLVGGLLPPGAVCTDVVDDRGQTVVATVGDGAYAAIVDRLGILSPVAVCCRAVNGSPVRRPLPGVYPSAPVVDAEDACPACGATDYEECFPTEEWRGGTKGADGRLVPSPIVVCRVCGHQEDSFRGGSSHDDEDEALSPEELALLQVEQHARMRDQYEAPLRAVRFPIYAAEGWPAQIGKSVQDEDVLVSLTVRHNATEGADLLDDEPLIEVGTHPGDSSDDELATAHDSSGGELETARGTLASWLWDGTATSPWPALSNAALSLRSRAIRRRVRRAALTSARNEARIPIDGSVQPFLTLTASNGRWVAVRRHRGVTVVIAARDIDPEALVLAPLADPVADLLGSEPGTR